jgi:hypothetical protein
VTKVIVEMGEQTGADDEEDDYERYGLYFSEAIGYINLVQLETWSFRRIRGRVGISPRIVPVHQAESSIGDVAANPGNPKRDGLAGPASADPRALVGPV